MRADASNQLLSYRRYNVRTASPAGKRGEQHKNSGSSAPGLLTGDAARVQSNALRLPAPDDNVHGRYDQQQPGLPEPGARRKAVALCRLVRSSGT